MPCSNGVCTPTRMPNAQTPNSITAPQAQGASMPQPYQQVQTIQPGNQGSWWQNFLSGARNLLVGHPEVLHILENLDPNQLQTQQTLGQSGLNLLQNPYQGFENVEKGALSNFSQDIVPALLERFSASGSNSSSSPVIQQQLSSAGANLAERLAGFREQFAQQNRGNALQQLQLSLAPHRDFAHSQATTGLVGGFANTAGQGAGKALGQRFFS